MSGWITIGTKLDTKDLEKDLRNAERELQQFERESEKLTKQKVKIEADLSEIELAKQLIQEETDEILKKAGTEEQVNNILADEKSQLDLINAGYELSKQDLDEINKKIQANTHNQELTRGKIQEINTEMQKTQAYDNMKTKIDSIGNSISNVVKKVGKWALAVFGLRSAYMFVRQAMSTLSGYNDELATDIEYIRFALATALQPVIETIINLAYKLLSLIAFIGKSLFGVNIFANATADAFKRTKKEVGGTGKAVSQLQKQLAGFDEMNILQENGGTSGGGGGGGGIDLPSFDLSNIEAPDLSVFYSWTDKLKELFNKAFENIKKNVKKVMKELGFSPEYIKAWEIFVNGVKDVLNGLLDFIGGLLEFIVGLVTGDTEKVKEGIKKMAIGIWEIIKGLAENIIGVFGMILVGLYDTLIKPIIGVINDINNTISRIITDLVNFIINAFARAGNGIKNTFNNIVGFINGIINTINGKFAEMGSKIGGAVGGAFKTVINGVLAWIEGQLNKPIDTINNLISVISKVGINVSRLSRIRLPRLAKGGIINQPGRGVPVGNALAGERGQEGVIPLTDSQQMALLGEAIGKYITINANITNTMNGRVISRELQKINNESDFAFNR